MTEAAPGLGRLTRPAQAHRSPEALTLYHYPSCPFCMMVRAAARSFPGTLSLRDIHRDEGALDELVAVTGRRTVPVLRIARSDGEDQWLPESADIIAYLRSLKRDVVAP